MKRSWIGFVSCLLLFTVLLLPAFGQTSHGINWTLSPVTTDVNGNTIVVDGYNLYCGTSSTGPFTKANTSLITGLAFAQTGLTIGNTYYCQETAQKNSVESVHSPTSVGVLFQFPPAAPAAPQGAVF